MTRRDARDGAKSRRLVEALRANLKKRKAQSRARRGGAGVSGQEAGETPTTREDRGAGPEEWPDEE